MNEVWITVISHRHGTNVYANATELGARDALFAYVVQEWAPEGLFEKHGPIDNLSTDRAIELYFEEMQDQEDWEVEKVTVGP